MLTSRNLTYPFLQVRLRGGSKRRYNGELWVFIFLSSFLLGICGLGVTPLPNASSCDVAISILLSSLGSGNHSLLMSLQA